MKQRIAYIVSRFPHLPETFILREMIELEKQGIDIELFPLVIQEQDVLHKESKAWLNRARSIGYFSWKCISANFRKFFRNPWLYITTLFKIFWFNLPSLKFLLRALYIFPVAVWMAQEIELLNVGHIHAHYATHPALAAFVISSFTQIPYSITVHAHDIYVNRTMLKQKAKKAGFIRAISKFNKDFLGRHLGNWIADRIFVIHCGIRLKNYDSIAKKESKDNALKIITVGSLQPYKGHEYLIRACQILKDKDFEFVCRIVGGGGRQAELTRLIEQMGLEEHVKLLGPKPEGQVAELLAQSDCFVLPSVVTPSGKMEGIPVVLMEALASKLPVIATNISGIPEIIQDGISGLLAPQKDPINLAEKIIWMSQHPEEAGKMVEKGYQIVSNEFVLEKNVTELKKLFRQNYKKK